MADQHNITDDEFETSDRGRPNGNVIEIFVNARPHLVDGKEVTYEQVVELAFPGQAPGADTEYIVTYTRAQHGNESGSLTPGGRVRVKKGTSFAVQITTRS
ncbi:multiubiquitin domain-containing protein [Microbacterium sp. KSW4-11]|uniref:Multiubiquitin domain-containing protein n=1 Tax=Microbacterium gawkjiense TaxID=3067309 RepID=A0ABU3G751_9MICO|nr:multiubiquitin domain-containing protein [Microbacterium sp. KSW4-11]MDT3315654.1 multiubiquitin domain-containing protein [Microbacterium sp. KSW4-11]